MPTLWLTLVLTSVVFGYAGNFYAKKTGRDPVRWTILGVVLNVLVLAVMLIVGNRSAKAREFVQ